ncbi:hypothetical protein [Caenimonas sp. SL110]|uniref:hypothetical protein n=1 Tax=Caenimonas sp. SL110 TaxID=1450524 RepID=UPI000652FBA6|nr:hypothetical protein [Caenimonas sp. SL110]
MRWFKPNLRSSIYAIFGSGLPEGPSVTRIDVVDMEVVRAEMLALLDGAEGERVPSLRRRIAYAGEIQGLWFLRGELMAVLANLHGETVARELIGEVSQLFDGLVPEGLRSRPSPLGG